MFTSLSNAAWITRRLSILPLFLLICLFACSHSGARSAHKRPIVSEIVPPAKALVPKHLSQKHANTDILLALRSAPLIIIDAGHGKKDWGTYSATAPKYKEKTLNLTTANVLKGYLQQLGYRALMTRSDDAFVTLDGRTEFANEKNATLFVSVHYNSAPNKEAEGVEVFYYRSDTDKVRSADSKRLAQAVLQQVIKNTEAKSRGVKHGNLAVLRTTKMPAILIECGFLTNANELQKIMNTSYQKRIAWGIAQGIHDYLSHDKNTKSVLGAS